MIDRPAQFHALLARVLARFFAQNGAEPPGGSLVEALAGRLWALVEERGLPSPPGDDEPGPPGEMPEAESAALVARVVPAGAPPLFADAARQLVKACFYPELKVCRDSFRAVKRDGSCRRQELAPARQRVSGTHCVDCPHWVALGPAEHEAFLQAQWREGGGRFAAHRGVYLPEDFRALRQWLHRAARGGNA